MRWWPEGWGGNRGYHRRLVKLLAMDAVSGLLITLQRVPSLRLGRGLLDGESDFVSKVTATRVKEEVPLP